MTRSDAPHDPAASSAARRNRTRFVILGLLTQAPGSAYALRQRIAESVGHFWQESYGQLFPTLARLEAEGLVRGVEHHDGNRRRRDYQITDAGRTALAGWLKELPAPQPERNELLLKVFFASEGDIDALSRRLIDAGLEADAQLDRLRGIEAFLRATYGSDPRLPFWLLTVRYGILGAEALQQWCEEAIRAFEGARPDRSP